MADTFHLAEASDEDGFHLSRFVSLLGVQPNCGGTFRPAPGAPLIGAWKVWVETLFLPALLPAFAGAFEAASSHRTQEIVTRDRSLDPILPETIREWSLSAGKPFLEGKREMRGHREWARFAEQVESGNSPGHLCTLFAAQSALYHLALPAALCAYASYEFQSRQEKFPFPAMTLEEIETFSNVLPRIPLAVRDIEAENGNEDGMLRVI